MNTAMIQAFERAGFISEKTIEGSTDYCPIDLDPNLKQTAQIQLLIRALNIHRVSIGWFDNGIETAFKIMCEEKKEKKAHEFILQHLTELAVENKLFKAI